MRGDGIEPPTSETLGDRINCRLPAPALLPAELPPLCLSLSALRLLQQRKIRNVAPHFGFRTRHQTQSGCLTGPGLRIFDDRFEGYAVGLQPLLNGREALWGDTQNYGVSTRREVARCGLASCVGYLRGEKAKGEIVSHDDVVARGFRRGGL